MVALGDRVARLSMTLGATVFRWTRTSFLSSTGMDLLTGVAVSGLGWFSVAGFVVVTSAFGRDSAFDANTRKIDVCLALFMECSPRAELDERVGTDSFEACSGA